MAAPIYGQVTSSGTAQRLSATNVSPTYWTLKVTGSTVYIGDRGVTTATGFPVLAGESLEFDLRQTAGAAGDVMPTPSDLYVVGSGGVVGWLGFR